MRTIDGMVAWVTGAGSGIGRAGAEALAGAGAKVVLSGRRVDALEKTAATIRDRGGEAIVEALDVADAQAVAAVAKRIADRFGRLDILVNNAGLNMAKRHWNDMDLESWEKIVQVDLNGAFYVVHAALPIMRAQKDGLIINVASMAGKRVGYVSGVPYTAAKHGLVAMNETINFEECHNGIRATALSPGEVATEILEKRPVPVTEEARAKMVQSEDMGEIILFLARQPKHVCINELLVTPTWNRGNFGGPDFFPKRD